MRNKSLKRLFIFGTIIFSLAVTAGVVSADDGVDFGTEYGVAQEDQAVKHSYGFGWQHTKPAQGFSVKIPVGEDYYLQPLLSFSIDRSEDQTSGHYDLGIRGLYLFPNQGFLQPYIGVGWGRSRDYDSKESAYGYEAFAGIEYREYFLVPALELGLGGHSKSDDSFHAGTTIGFSLFYYF